MAEQTDGQSSWEKVADRLVDLLRLVAMRVVFTETMKNRVLTRLNEKVDIPILEENEEHILFDTIWSTIQEAVEEDLSDEEIATVKK